MSVRRRFPGCDDAVAMKILRAGSMPKRTNEFQQLVAYIYSKITPMGGQVTESAELFSRHGWSDCGKGVSGEYHHRPQSGSGEC
jgi:hypothetical protein